MNWFRKEGGKFIWPGFGENARVLEWIFNRTDNADNGQKTAVGILPKPGRYSSDLLLSHHTVEMRKMSGLVWSE